MRRRPLKVAVLGFGAIGRALAARLGTLQGVETAILIRREASRQVQASASAVGTVVHDNAGLSAFGADVIVECAGHQALAEYGEPLLAQGARLIVASVGALADADLEARLTTAAAAGDGILQIVAGAIAGLDALSSIPKGAIEEVRYSGTKPPAAWRGTPAQDMVDLDQVSSAAAFFTGSAREAALLFPKNANVIAATALAGLGFDRTRAELWVDPAATGNIHRFAARGHFGQLDINISSTPLQDNVKSSALTPESLLRAVRNLVAPVVI